MLVNASQLEISHASHKYKLPNNMAFNILAIGKIL